MKHLIGFEIFNEGLGGDESNQQMIIQAIGALKNPPNEVLGTPKFNLGDQASKEMISILKEMLKTKDRNGSDMEKVSEILNFISELHERSKKDQSVVTWLDKYQKDGQKETVMLSPVKKMFPNREKDPLFGK